MSNVDEGTPTMIMIDAHRRDHDQPNESMILGDDFVLGGGDDGPKGRDDFWSYDGGVNAAFGGGGLASFDLFEDDIHDDLSSF